MKYLSLFSGIGGFELGMHNAYVETTHRTQNRRSETTATVGGRGGHEKTESPCAERRSARKHHHRNSARQELLTCVGYSEINAYAITIYEKHFPHHKNFGDVTTINTDSLPDFDLLVGGFPCQSFSIAGKRGGFNDTRGTLFFDIARILECKKPALFLLENVKGLLSHGSGDTFKTIISTLAELGYCLEWQVLNSKNFGVPQNRERVFIVGYLGEKPRSQVFPITKNDCENLVLPTITTRVTADSNGTYVSKRSPHQIIGGSQGNRVYNPDGIAPTLASQSGGLGAKTGLYAFTDIQDENPIIRRLTPTECERLQGFPDGWTEGVSDTQRYKTLGNAVTVPVVRAIAQRLFFSTHIHHGKN